MVQNSAPYAEPGETGAQAVAARINGDMAAFYGCGFVSSQDTICDEGGRHYFRDCYIEGNIDIIWGNGQSLYKVLNITLSRSFDCHIQALFFEKKNISNFKKTILYNFLKKV